MLNLSIHTMVRLLFFYNVIFETAKTDFLIIFQIKIVVLLNKL